MKADTLPPATPPGPSPDLSRLLALGFERDAPPAPALDATRVERRAYRVTGSRPAMGTLVTMAVLARSASRGEEAIGRAFEVMDRLIASLSRFEGDSAVSVLNGAGRLRHPPRELVQVLARSRAIHRATGGAFDVTVWPILALFGARLGGPSPRPPTAGELAEARSLVGADRVATTRREVRLGRAGMAVTVDGIAKGFIVDRMAASLERRGVRRYLIDAGGDIRVRGRKEGGLPWAVAVRDPEGGGLLAERVAVTGGAVATSGGYERYFDAERRYHHIVEAAAGVSPAESGSATVLARDAMTADALATALFTMTPAAALSLAASRRGCECLIIDRRGRAHRSAGWPGAAPSQPGGVEQR